MIYYLHIGMLLLSEYVCSGRKLVCFHKHCIVVPFHIFAMNFILVFFTIELAVR